MARRLLIGLVLALAVAASTAAAGDDLRQQKDSIDAQLAELQDKITQTREQESALKPLSGSVILTPVKSPVPVFVATKR